jgi:hypothetical protein
MQMRRLVFTALASWGVGCSGGRTDTGTGTGTLLAAIEVEGSANGTSIDVMLTLRGNPVPSANVVFTDVDSGQTLALDQIQSGAYRGSFGNYHRTLKVKITSGDDTLSATLEGPSPHVITRPPNDAIVERAGFMFLRVEWQAPSAAQRVVIVPDGIDPITLDGDPFFATIPLMALKDQTQMIEVRRETSVDLAGGAQGSKMTTRYKVDNSFTLEG